VCLATSGSWIAGVVATGVHASMIVGHHCSGVSMLVLLALALSLVRLE
jgi:hypothetical protein